MESFVEFVTDERVIECVCRIRASVAAKRHDAHHRHLISSDSKIPIISHDVYRLTPSRRKWVRLGEKYRFLSDSESKRQTISTLDRTYYSVLLTIKRDLKEAPDASYLLTLKEFLSDIKNRIKDASYVIKPPQTIPILKKRVKDGLDEYRPICVFNDIYDSIIVVLANRYLSKLFDNYFYEDSLAFRPKRLFHGEKIFTSHHDAIRLILNYLNRIGNKSVYVAECDMQKFYDTVDHNVVKCEFNRLIAYSKEKYPYLLFDDIKRIFYSYLDCYSFTECVWKKNNDKSYWEKYDICNGEFGWVENYKRLVETDGGIPYDVGVPQGGAISGLVANIVLNRVDDKVKKFLKNDNDLYIRYCDDMILLSTNKKRCKRIFNVYRKEIKNAKLIAHEPADFEFGTSNYWKAKTKNVYEWSTTNLLKGQRWIGFVGYEISRSGEIRIRKSSIKKEKRKQRKVVNEIFDLTYGRHRVCDNSMKQSYQSTLISMAVGRVTLWNYKSLKNELCWINGFKMLNDNSTVSQQIKDLDRCRNRVIRRANNSLKKLNSIVGGRISKEGNNPNAKENEDKNQLVYFGKPYSYYYHYKKALEINIFTKR